MFKAWQVNEYDTVAADTAEQALEWYTTDSDYIGEECYSLDEVEEVSLDTEVRADVYDGESIQMVTIRELIETNPYNKPYVVCSTEW